MTKNNEKLNDFRNQLEKSNSEKKDLSRSELSNLNLNEINLVNAKLNNSNLSRTSLENASLYGADLSSSDLFKANFEGANLSNSNLTNCNLLGVNFTNSKLRNINWGKDFKVKNELDADQAMAIGNYELAIKKYKESEDIYRNLKISMQSQTLGYETGEFFIREMTVRRKQFKKISLKRLGSKIIEITTGYGERLSNIFGTMIFVIVICMLLYGLEGVRYSDPINGDRIIGFFSQDTEKFGLFNTIGNLFYFSVVVYSTVGFGEIVPIGPIGKSVMIFEGIIGGLILAILIIALYKKSMDR
tara:strand:- start:275 stop:1177 length:903 start_codon:yes stop_codon:yes gene_type:complete